MASVTDLKIQQHKEAENRRFSEKMNELQSKHSQRYQNTVQKKKMDLKKIKNSYETKISNLKNDMERKLTKLRRKHDQTLESEKSRLQQEIKNLKKSHESQVKELKMGQNSQIEEMQESHKQTLERARQRFKNAQMKYEEA